MCVHGMPQENQANRMVREVQPFFPMDPLEMLGPWRQWKMVESVSRFLLPCRHAKKPEREPSWQKEKAQDREKTAKTDVARRKMGPGSKNTEQT